MKLRMIEMYNKNAEVWVEIDWKDLKKGMLFRLDGISAPLTALDDVHYDTGYSDEPNFWVTYDDGEG